MLKKSLTLAAAVLCMATYATSLTQGKPAEYTGNFKLLSNTPEGKLQIKTRGAWLQKKYMDIKDTKLVRTNFEFSKTSGEGTGGIGVVCYDKDKKMINITHVNRVAGTDTVLAKPCTFTDSKIYVKDGSKWRKGGIYLAAFETKPDFSDLPNRNITRIGIKDVKKLADGTWEISFSNEIGKEYPAGANIREHATGGTYDYLYYGKLSDMKKTNDFPVSRMRPGTQYIGFIILVTSTKDFSTELTYNCNKVK